MGAPGEDEGSPESEPLVTCTLQGGTLSVHDDHVSIERSSASMFEDKRIPMAEIRGVEFTAGITTGHIQILQAGVEPDEAGLLSHPVDENTLYVSRLRRGCAERARDDVLERAGLGTRPRRPQSGLVRPVVEGDDGGPTDQGGWDCRWVRRVRASLSRPPGPVGRKALYRSWANRRA